MKTAFISLLVFAAPVAFTSEAGYDLTKPSTVQSAVSRESVRQAYIAARRDGTLPVTGEAGEDIAKRAAFQSTVSRDSVTRDYFSARRNGTLPVTGEAGEDIVNSRTFQNTVSKQPATQPGATPPERRHVDDVRPRA